MEKKIYKLAINQSNYPQRYGTGSSFGWHTCSRTTSKKPYSVSMLSSAQFCREGFIAQINNAVNLRDVIGMRYFGFIAARISNAKQDPKVNRYDNAIPWADRFIKITDDYRKLFISESSATINKAVNFVNLFEKEAGWPLTKVHPMKVETGIKEIKNDEEVMVKAYYYIKASSWWAASPQLLSLFILLLRNGAHIKPPLFKVIKNVEQAVNSDPVIYSLSDRTYLKGALKLTLPIMRDRVKLFPGKLLDNWDKEKFNNSVSVEGITTLVKGVTRNPELKARFAKMRTKWANESRTKARKKAKEVNNGPASRTLSARHQ